MNPTTNIKTRVGLLCLALACSAKAPAADGDRVYTSGFSSVMKLAGELHDILPDKFLDKVDAQAIALQPEDLPLIAPVCVNADNRVERQVELSAGFVDLVNHLCHAKAINRVQADYYDQYVKILARAYALNPEAPMPPIVDPRFWKEDILNEQLGYYNQMMGMMVAINMAHHYLGHYAKYAGRLAAAGDQIAPINNFLTPAEWDVAVKAGTLQALNLALSTEGLRALFEALDKMPTRPTWTSYIAPQNVDFKKLNKELTRYEDDFYHGRLKN
jgi:hypothetical protein